MPIKLKELIIDRVDLVKQGDNPEAFVRLFKGKDQDVPPNTIADKPMSYWLEEFKKLFTKGAEESMAEFDLNKFLEEQDEETRKALEEAMSSEDKDEQINTLTTKISELEEQLENQEKAADDDDEDDDEDDMMKSLPENVRKMLEDSQKRVEEAEKLAKELKDQQLNNEYVDKAKQFSEVVTDATILGPVLKRIAEINVEDYQKIESVLKAANEMVERNNILLKELGADGTTDSGNGDAWDQIEKAAKTLMDTDSSLTEAMAISKAIRENPDLYKQYRKESEEV